MRPITRRSTLALPVAGWACALTPVSTRSSTGSRQTTRSGLQYRDCPMVVPPCYVGSSGGGSAPDGAARSARTRQSRRCERELRELVPTDRTEPESPATPRAERLKLEDDRNYAPEAIAVKGNLGVSESRSRPKRPLDIDSQLLAEIHASPDSRHWPPRAGPRLSLDRDEH